jgi:hypothetical protein
VGLALVRLWRRARAASRPADVFLLVAWPVLAFLLAALMHYKRYYYVLLLMPFLALQLGYAVQALWTQTRWRSTWVRAALGLVLALAVVEGAAGVGQSFRAARATTRYAALSEQLRQAIRPGASLLMAEPYWLGLSDHDARSIQLAFLLSDAHYYAQPPAVADVLLDLRPDYVVTEERLLDIYGRDPGQVSDNALDWRELDAYLKQHCPVIAADVHTADYGQVKVYQCEVAAGAVE